MHVTILAAVTPDNSPHGYNWTFAFPMLLFVVIAGGLYLILTRPHKVPGHGTLSPALMGRAPGAAVPPDAGSARAAAVATGFTTAPGGGAGESPAEPGGAHRVTNLEPESDTVTAGDMLEPDGSVADSAPAPSGTAPSGTAPSGTAPSGDPAAGRPSSEDPEASA